MNSHSTWENLSSKTTLAAIVGMLLLLSCFIAAYFTHSNESIFALTPKVADGTTIPVFDIIVSNKLFAFHATIYTIWATMLICLPAFCTVWFIRSSSTAGAYWLSFWTMGLIAMLVHMYLAMGVLFEWNWQHILKETVRVTTPVPDLVLIVWWTIDVILGWLLLHSRGYLLHGQRIFLHFALLVIFLFGFIREGEILISKGIGIVSALAVGVALVAGLTRRSRET